MRKNMNADMGQNLKMNDQTYALRREVMNYIYEAKNVLKLNNINMPRVDVRITDNSGERGVALGMGRLKDNIIWISTKALTTYKASLRDIVYHELIHAVTGFVHDDNCPLMKPCLNIKPLSDEVANTLLIKYFKMK